MEKISLNNGRTMPEIGFGTFPMKGIKLITAVRNAIKVGYTCFDSSPSYNNEFTLGLALKLSGKKREELYIITKVSNADQRKGNIKKALKKSLIKLNTKYIDLYLMHWPNPDTYIDTWKQMEELYFEGKVKAIGVCNCHKHHLEKIMEIARVIPVVNEIELHPLLNQELIVRYCNRYDIKIISYSPFARMDKKLIENSVLKEIAERYNKSVTQIILRWNIQKGYMPIPKTEKVERMIDNISINDFKLTKEEMLQIDNINENYRVRHNPDTCDYSKL